MSKQVFKLFPAWKDDQEENWLSEMAQDGWRLSSYRLGIYSFEPSSSIEEVYRLDYKGSSDRDLEDYKSLFEDAGWEHVTRFHGWHYFRKPLSDGQDTSVIYTDQVSEGAKYKQLLTLLLPLFLLIIGSVISLQAQPGYTFVSIIKWIFFSLITFYIYAMLRVYIKMKKVQKTQL